MRTSVIVVDMLNDFVTGALKCERASRIIPNIQRLLDFARKEGIPIIYVSDAHLPGVDNELELWPPHAMVGTKGAEIIEELKPVKGDYTLQKRRYSAFYETGLEPLLRELKVDTVVLVGLVTNVCIQHTAADAFFRGYRIIVPEDCVEAPTEQAQKIAIKYLKTNYGSEITNVQELRKLIEKETV
ncbi:MAG: cysteine hydrolase [Candidatus Bathyarchaeota archaeon]|nr:cysteine hydrolase [Candidatus Bathyarchaeota archaeon]MDH5713440.1 cysteine hydrolase [Candidatus Bathyarchaeota archaeon]